MTTKALPANAQLPRNRNDTLMDYLLVIRRQSFCSLPQIETVFIRCAMWVMLVVTNTFSSF